MLSSKLVRILCGLVPIGFSIVVHMRRHKVILEQIENEVKEMEKATNRCIFFKASSNSECDRHIYTKLLCSKPDCPYAKLCYIMECLDSSRLTLDVCIHLLTSIEIANCLLNVSKRGVKVRIICDNEMSTNKGSQVRVLSEAKIAVRIPILNYHMHSKMAIIDRRNVLTGSVNWTVQGMYGNWDNLIITSQKDVVKDCIDSFELMWNGSETEMYC